MHAHNFRACGFQVAKKIVVMTNNRSLQTTNSTLNYGTKYKSRLKTLSDAAMLQSEQLLQCNDLVHSAVRWETQLRHRHRDGCKWETVEYWMSLKANVGIIWWS